jgi:hypothetical protein
LGDVRTLLIIGYKDGTASVIDAVVGVVVADALDGVARDLDVVDIGGRGDFSSQNNETCISQGFRGHAGEPVLGEDGIEDGIGDLVGNFIRMTLRYRLGREQKIG